MRLLICAAAAAALAGCATPEPYPNMRPLTQAHIDQMGPTKVVVSENNNGVEKSWFYSDSSAAAGSYGLIGALVSAAMDAMVNAGPSLRSKTAAAEIAEQLSIEDLNASLLAQMRERAAGAPVMTASAVPGEAQIIPASVDPAAAKPSGVSYETIESAQRLLAKDVLDDAIELTVHYTLSEDSSTLRVMANVTYQSAATPYVTPYKFKAAAPRPEREGPAYRNTFTYYSTQLPIPTLTQEMRDKLAASVENNARDASGALPGVETAAYKNMQQELVKARDNTLTKDEIALFLTREWAADNGARLRREINQAHTFIAGYVVQDLNRTAIPSITGQDELLETMADSRTVRRVGAGTAAGSYISSAGNVTSFSTYGNTYSIAPKYDIRMGALRRAPAAAPK